MPPRHCKWGAAYFCKSKHSSNHSRSVQLETIFWRAYPIQIGLWAQLFPLWTTAHEVRWKDWRRNAKKKKKKCSALFKSRSVRLARCEGCLSGTWKRMYITTGTKEAIRLLCSRPSSKNPPAFGYTECSCQNRSSCRSLGDTEFPSVNRVLAPDGNEPT